MRLWCDRGEREGDVSTGDLLVPLRGDETICYLAKFTLMSQTACWALLVYSNIKLSTWCNELISSDDIKVIGKYHKYV